MLELYQNYIAVLTKSGFQGEIRTDYASRLTAATDNSIYQIIPQAVIFPRTVQDIAVALSVGHKTEFQAVKFSPRGGGTGTNGQSLSPGIIVDCSKYMRSILELNLAEMWVRVQPGVILDQLNDFLRPHGVHFAPEISPSNRATIGGMVNTDACGIGSKILGRTSDHVLELHCVGYDGKTFLASDMNRRSQEIVNLLTKHQDLIATKFTNAPRTLSGYNLKKALFNLNYLFCGSEGTLAIIGECKLKLSLLPKFKRVVVIKYPHFNAALRAQNLTALNPLVIETIDEKLLDLARTDPDYFLIKDFIEPAGAINIAEFVSDNAQDFAQLDALLREKILENFYIAKNSLEEKLLWNLRKKSVGLISKKVVGTRRPIPFIEDTAVPPEHLADYIEDFKSLLDHYGLTYGMYGHVDAGCIHVRPALDMKTPQDEKLIRELSDKVVALVKKYNGVLWGEHGQGFRSEFGKDFFGDTLYAVVRQIKTWFDPFNQLNPGKIAVPLTQNEKLVSLDGPLRGSFEKHITEALQQQYATTIACNGNGACFNYATQETMCPSYKVTRDRVHSPKGRAAIVREWLRLGKQKKGKNDFSHEVYGALSGCLGCKACATQCPLNVDVPQFKSEFLSTYHQRYRRPLRDFFFANSENIAYFGSRFPRFLNWFLKQSWFQTVFQYCFKLADIPVFPEISIKEELLKRKAFDKSKMLHTNPIILLQDAFTSFYDPKAFLGAYDFLSNQGYSVYVPPFFVNGKPLHAKGFLQKFNALVKKNIKTLNQFAQFNAPIVGIDPSITLTYRDEYLKVKGEPLEIKVQMLQEFLFQNSSLKAQPSDKTFYLLTHCTEKSLCPETEKQWQQFFSAMGLSLIPLPAGCCGMAGSYGHEAEHVQNSKQLFNMDWQKYIAENPDQVLATGYSCRSQTKRMTGIRIRHPLEIFSNNNS